MLTVITPAASHALTSVETAERELLLTLTEETAGLLHLIHQASAACALFCRRPEGFGRATVRQTERLQRSRRCIVLDRDINPVVSAVTLDGVALTAADYELDGDQLLRLDDEEWVDWEAGKVVVDYAAGFTLLTDLPHDIERACLITLAAMHAQRGRDPAERSRDDGLVSAAYRTDMVPMEAQQLLAPWRRYYL